MKRSTTTKLLIMGVAPLLLAACDVPDQQDSSAPAPSSTAAATAARAAADAASDAVANADATVVNHQFQSVDECTKAGNPQDVCEKAFEQSKQFAADAAPHFDSHDACIREYGSDRCEEHHDGSGNSFWGPMMTGFMLSQILSSSNQPAYVVAQSQPIYQRVGGGYYVPSSNGWSSGASRASGVSSSGWVPSNSSAGKNMVTASRGGFGSIAAARGSWGGGSFGG